MPLYLDLNLIKIIKPSNTTLGESQFTRYSVKLPGPGNFTEYLVTCDSPSVVFDGLTHWHTQPPVRRSEPSMTFLLILAFCQ